MSETVSKATFESLYAGQAPWDIDHPQAAFVAVADAITGSVLDAGCGTGENALYFAAKGRTVTGIDFIPQAIERAQHKAAERGVKVTQQELRQAFANGWTVESIQSARLETIPNLKDFMFSEGGPKAWFAILRRL
jgi:2-polyprenyl-3-methyl-5-hydroxy-6-metoxy-1,4-benzoquinol methylase